tara:strand:- start:3 stop:134 length:132 start_codon:yes stop_codon:yes gene_type:complete
MKKIGDAIKKGRKRLAKIVKTTPRSGHVGIRRRTEQRIKKLVR